MPQIYDKPVRLLMQDMAQTMGGRTFTTKEAIGWFASNYPLIKKATITAHLTRLSTNAPSRTYYSATADDDILFQLAPGKYRLYDLAIDPPPLRSKQDVASEEDDESGPTAIGSDEFAYESDLRDYLAKNLTLIEDGLVLYEDEGIKGIEFPAGGRFIDILAIDSENRLVVIELKVSKGYDRVMGQLMRYMAWIQSNLAESGQAVRGIIAARHISEDLKLACSLLPNCDLFEYSLSISLNKVQIPNRR